jgi:2,3-dihydroxybenzoate decarboxylase
MKKGNMGRREFLGKALVAATAIPATMQGGIRTAKADDPAKKQAKGPGPKRKIKKIGIEEHWGNDELNAIGMAWRAKLTGVVGVQKPSPDFIERLRRQADFEKFRLPLMDESGIAMQVLALGSPGVQAVTDGPKAIDVAKRTNDFQAEIIRKHPTRFAGFAALPTADPKAAADELERAVKQLKFKGAMIQGHTNFEYLDARKYWVIWERAAALEVPIYLHVSDPTKEASSMYADYPEMGGPTWGWGVETGNHALRIVMSGLFDAFPKASLILGHLGESLPYLLGRIDEGYGYAGAGKLKKQPSAYLRENLYVTTSGLYRPEALQCAIAALGADRVFFAVDYPFVDPKASVEAFDGTPMSDADREKIAHANSERVLRL